MSDRKKKVLVVEDNIINTKLLTVFLEEAGFEVITAEDGDAGYTRTITERDIDVILLDRVMPKMDGLDVLIRFKRGVQSAHIPVIMLTAALSPDQITKAVGMGAYGCLSKPYEKDKIVKMIKEALGLGGVKNRGI